MQQTEMPNDILKLLEGGIDLVLSGGETYRGEKWYDKDNLAQSDVRMKALLEDNSIQKDVKQAFIQQLELGWEDWQLDEGAPQRAKNHGRRNSLAS